VGGKYKGGSVNTKRKYKGGSVYVIRNKKWGQFHMNYRNIMNFGVPLCGINSTKIPIAKRIRIYRITIELLSNDI